MPAGNEILSRLRRTMQSIFRIGNIQVKDNSGIAETRNSDDTAYADVGSNRVIVHGDNATNAVILDAPAALGSSPVFVLPSGDGSTGQVLQTDGSGNLSFTDVASNANLTQVEAFTEATLSPLTLFTPPANAIIEAVYIDLSSAAAGSGASISVGTSEDPDAYFQTDEIDMQFASIYKVHPLIDVTGTPDPVIATITPGAQSFSGDIYVQYSNPS